MTPSSKRLSILTLTSTEISVLDMLSSALLTYDENSNHHIESTCQVLEAKNFAVVRQIRRHGDHNCITFNAWDITNEGRNWLLNFYKRTSSR